jgi:hypothetical protein
MNFIQRVKFINNEFFVICGGDISNVDVKFKNECCMEIGYITPWRSMQGMKDETILSHVRSGEFSIKEMHNEF